MDRIDDLLGAVTLAEKLGQLAMNAAAYAVTGPVIAGDLKDAVLTALFNESSTATRWRQKPIDRRSEARICDLMRRAKSAYGANQPSLIGWS